MTFDFDQVLDLRHSNSAKWREYGDDSVPLWVADMDFRAPEPVLRALQAKIDFGVFGYEYAPPGLTEAVCQRMERLYGWHITPEQVIVHPGLVSATNVLVRALCGPGEGALMQTPVYPPFLHAPVHQGALLQTAELTAVPDGTTLRYEIDFDAFEAAITEQTRLFLLCQPHNPTGQIYSREQLTRLAEICQRHNLVIGSDEIHSELLLGSATHVPLAPVVPEIAERTVTLIAPSKTFNLPGLFCSFVIAPNAELRQKFIAAREGIVPHPNSLGMAAALAAFTECDDWLAALRAYLTANRDALVSYVAERLPGIRTTVPDATYLAWLDCRALNLPVSPFEFFLKQAKVALVDGALLGPGGQGFVRLNFGCPRATLIEALDRMKTALAQRER